MKGYDQYKAILLLFPKDDLDCHKKCYKNTKGYHLYFLGSVFPGPTLTMIFDFVYCSALEKVLGFELKGSVTQQAGRASELGKFEERRGK